MNWEIGADIYALLMLWIKLIMDENLLYSTGNRLSALWRPKGEGNPEKEGICEYV